MQAAAVSLKGMPAARSVRSVAAWSVYLSPAQLAQADSDAAAAQRPAA